MRKTERDIYRYVYTEQTKIFSLTKKFLYEMNGICNAQKPLTMCYVASK